MENKFFGIAPNHPARKPTHVKASPRTAAHTITINKLSKFAPETGEPTFKTATRDDVSKLDSWVHGQLSAVHNKGATNPDQVMANTFEQIRILDVAHDKVAAMVGFHCNMKEELIRRIWSSSAELYNRVYAELSNTVNELKFKLMDRTTAMHRLEDQLDIYISKERQQEQNAQRAGGQSASHATGGGTHAVDMSFNRQQEEELILKNRELMELQGTLTSLAVWFPQFDKYGPSVLRRYLPPVQAVDSSSSEGEKKEGEEGVGGEGVGGEGADVTAAVPGALDLAQHYLLQDLKRLEEIGIGFQVVDASDLTPTALGTTTSAPATASNQSQSQQQNFGHNQSHHGVMSPPLSQKSVASMSSAGSTSTHVAHLRKNLSSLRRESMGSFCAASENEYNLSYDNPSATSSLSGRRGGAAGGFFGDGENGDGETDATRMYDPEELPQNDADNDAVQLAAEEAAAKQRAATLTVTVPPSPKQQTDIMLPSNFYAMQSKRLSLNSQHNSGRKDGYKGDGKFSFSEAAVTTAAQEQPSMIAHPRIDYPAKCAQLLEEAQRLECEIAALMDGNAREAAMHRRELDTLNAQVVLLSRQLQASSSQVTHMAGQLPVILFPPMIKPSQGGSAVSGAHHQPHSHAQQASLEGRSLSFVATPSLVMGAPAAPAAGVATDQDQIPLIVSLSAVEALVVRCLRALVASPSQELQSLLGHDSSGYDSLFKLFSGQRNSLGPVGDGQGHHGVQSGVSSSSMAHHLYQYLGRTTGSCSVAAEWVAAVVRAIELGLLRQQMADNPLYDSDSDSDGDNARTNSGSVSSSAQRRQSLAVYKLQRQQPLDAPKPVKATPSMLTMLADLFQLKPVQEMRSLQLAGLSIASIGNSHHQHPSHLPRPPPLFDCLADVIRFDLVVSCYKAMKNHMVFTPAETSEDGDADDDHLRVLSGQSTFPVVVTRRILKRVFRDPASIDGAQKAEQSDLTTVVWWRFLPEAWLDRLVTEVELSSLTNNINISSSKSSNRLGGGAPHVNCYDCILSAWQAAYTLRSQLTVMLAELYRFLISIIPQGPASASFHLLLTHMVTLPHERRGDLAGTSGDSTGTSTTATDTTTTADDDVSPPPPLSPATAVPVVNAELQSELLALAAQGGLNGESFADLLLRSLPASLMLNYAAAIPHPPQTSLKGSNHGGGGGGGGFKKPPPALNRQPPVSRKSEREIAEERFAALTASGKALVKRLTVILAINRNTKGVKPTLRGAVKTHLRAVKLASTATAAAAQESYFKQSVLLHQTLYPKATSQSSPADDSSSSSSTPAQSSAVERLLMHARLCFEDALVNVLTPTTTHMTFTVIALKYYTATLTRLLDCRRSLKTQFNRSIGENGGSIGGDISNDFLQVILGDTTATGTMSSSGNIDPSSGSTQGKEVVASRDAFDCFATVENYHYRRLKERVFRAWAKSILY